MKIVADENIPLVSHYFGAYGEIVLVPGRSLKRDDLVSADILLVRSVTEVNEKLLKKTNVKFVGTPGVGLDHMDTDWLDQNGILWTNASGCNADAVAEYIVCVIAQLQKLQMMPLHRLRAGVVGVGNIGSRMVQKLKLLNFEVVQSDPVRAEKEKGFVSTPLIEFTNLDLITLHTPLTRSGKDPTFHLIDKRFLQRQKPNGILLNTARGEVIASDDLKKYSKFINKCFDVWEDEPTIDLTVLQEALIASPHIAGHSVQSKYRGVEMIYQRAVEKGVIPKQNVVTPAYPMKTIVLPKERLSWRDVVLKVFNPVECTQYMKAELLKPKIPVGKTFDRIRKELGSRPEFGHIELKNLDVSVEDKQLLKQLGIHC